MVSPLWNAASEGHFESLLAVLHNASPADIEIKDHTGTTPLQEAVRNGHLDVVRALLDKGADPSFAITYGSPDTYTTNPEIIQLLKNASVKGLPPQDHPYLQDPNVDPSKRFYPVPVPPYGYYPSIAPVPSLPDGSPAYYQPPPVPLAENGAFGNLPPPDVARFIPCRYYPACRYGSSCLFAHPQGPFYPAPPPAPTQYPAPYDPVTQQQYAQSYYPPPSFHPPAPVPPHMNHVSPPPLPPVHTPPHPPMIHSRTTSDAFSPVQTPVQAPYAPMSPASPSYSQPPHAPLPLSIPTLPPPQQPATAPGPQSPQSMYPNGPVSAPPFAVRQDSSPYPPGPHSHSPYPEVNGGPKSPVPSHGENFGPPPAFRQGMNHNRRGGMRRGSFGGNRKPACLFYPAGRCRNGDDCRFPHVIPDTPAQPQLGTRGSRARDGANDISTIEENFATMNVRDDVQPRRVTNGTTNSSRSQSTDPGSRSKGLKSNGPRAEKKAFVKQQRVPNADEFPVLGGSTTTSSRSSVSGAPVTNGLGGPTAAQILQAPPPFRKDMTKEPGTRSVSPEERQIKSHTDHKLTEVHATQPNGATGNVAPKLPVSFATAATGTPESAKEVSVSA
ncbi:hypothetical protein OG21DRAFT_1480019 [Imleria badia]|nr:hypothetical protein OG21DRAFT_1480019 [Imleria badia]